MALWVSQARIVGRSCYVGAAAIALAIGMASLTGDGAAQQGPAKKAGPAGAASAGPVNAWLKLCGKTPVGVMFKDGKEEPRYGDFCVTQYERFDESAASMPATIAVRKSDAEDRPYFMVTVPLSMLLKAGVRASLYPAGLWEQAQKNEKIDETKLKGLKLDYKTCTAAGCLAEVEATPELFNDLKTFKGVAVFAINAEGAAVVFLMPLTGFEQALAGGPVDAKKYLEARQALGQKTAQRQRQSGEQQKQPSWQATPTPAPKK